MKISKYAHLKWVAIETGKAYGLPFVTEEGNFTPEFKAFWEIFEEEIHKWDSERCRRWVQTILSLAALVISLCTLI